MLCEELTAHCLVLGEASATLAAGRALYRDVIRSGRALEHFREMVRAQGGNPAVVERLLDSAAGAKGRGRVLAGARVRREHRHGRDWDGPPDSSAPAARRFSRRSIPPSGCTSTRRSAIASNPAKRSARCTVQRRDRSAGRRHRRVLECYRFSPVQTARPALIRKIVSLGRNSARVLEVAGDRVRDRDPSRRSPPAVGLILGSGLGDLCRHPREPHRHPL